MVRKTQINIIEHQQPLRLLRFFSIFSLVAFSIIAVVLGLFYRQIAVTELIELGEAKNVALTQTFSNSLWAEFAPFLTSLSELSGDEIRAHPETEKLHQAVVEQTRGLTVLKVKIYDLEGKTIFSSEESQIGDDKSENDGFLSALEGEVLSDLSHRDTFDAFEGRCRSGMLSLAMCQSFVAQIRK